MAWRGYSAGMPQWQQQQAQQPQQQQAQQPQQQQFQQPVQLQQQRAAATQQAANWQGTAPPATLAQQQAARRVAPVNAAAAAGESYVVFSRGEDAEEVVVRTLIGEYLEQGSNHGRKVYKKLSEKSPDAVDVFLYYWDSRDGPSFEGWWFGNKLGGTQVWSHNNSNALTPPSGGWKIPWDGGVRPTLAVMSKGEQQKTENEDRLKTATTIVEESNTSSNKALEEAKAAAGEAGSSEGLKKAESILLPQIASLSEALKKLMEAQRGVTGEASKQLMQLATQMRTIQQSVNAELTRIRSAKTTAEQALKNKAAEEKDLVALNEILPDAVNKTNLAEDAVEKALITSEMVEAGGEDMEEVRKAVQQTEVSAQEAQKAIGEARIFLNAKQASTRRLESTTVREKASAELSKLQAQLQEAQAKLNPLKTVRQDFLQRTAAQKLVAEILEKLTPAEVDVDRAEETTVMLESDELTKEVLTQAQQAVVKATENVNSCLKFIETKKKGLVGLALTELGKMEDRAQASMKKIGELKVAHKQASERVTVISLIKDAEAKLQVVVEAVSKAADAEGPFLMGVEELPLEDTLAAVKACETAATAANTSVSIAKMFLATKLVEAKRFSAGPSAEATTKLKELQGQLEVHMKKLTELKAATASRKKGSLMREAESEVLKAEGLAKRVTDIGAVFQDDKKLFELSSDEIKAAADEAAQAEQAANLALLEARKFITARQIEAKGREASIEMSAELIKFQTRLGTAQSEVAKGKKHVGSVDQRLAAKKSLEEATAKLQTAEEKAAKVSALAEALGEEGSENIDKAAKAIEAACAEAQVALKSVTRHLDAQARLQASVREEVLNLQPRVKAAQEKLDASMASMRERSEKLLVQSIVDESEKRVKEAEDAVDKLKEAEEPFFKEEAEETPSGDASTMIANLESAIGSANNTVGGAKTFLAMKRLAAKRLSEGAAKSTTDQLTKLQFRVDAVAKRLVDTKKGMAERKMKTVKREITAKVAEVSKKIDAATEATKALADENDIAPDEMKSACEKAGTAQNEAQTSLTDAKELLLSRQRDAKANSADSAMVAEVGKLLEQLTKAQAELDKQKNLLREQEHKFVAQRLLKDATEQVEKVEKKLEETTDKATPFTSSKSEQFTATVVITQLVDLLRPHLAKSSKTPADLFKDAGGKDGKAPLEKMVPFLQALPELTDQKEAIFTDEQLKSALSSLVVEGTEDVCEKEFLKKFISKYVCIAVVSMTDNLAVKGGKTVRKIDVNEVLEALSEPVKEEGLGLMRVKVKAEKDGAEGYITLAGNQGTVYLEGFSPMSVAEKQIQASIQELYEACKDISRYLDQKLEELKSVRSGPLADTKAKLMKMKPRVSKVHYNCSELRKRVAGAQKRHAEYMENEKKRRLEAADQRAAKAMIDDATKLVDDASEAVEKAIPAAEELVKTKGADTEHPLKAMELAGKDLDTACSGAEQAQAKLAAMMDELKTARGPFNQVRSTIVKLKVKVGALEAKCKKQVQALQKARKQVADDASDAVLLVFREGVAKQGAKPEELFKKLSGGKDSIKPEKLREYISGLKSTTLKPTQLDLGLHRYAEGMTKLNFCEMLQEYQKVVKEIAITSAFEVRESKTIRKLAVGEIVHVHEQGKTDDTVGLARIKCRAILDGAEGWVTLCGNQGTAFLQKTPKPWYCCTEETSMGTAFESGSSEARKLAQGELLEVIEGPRKEAPLETQRVKGKAGKDGKLGWATLKDAAGNSYMELKKLLVCKQSIAITTAFDIVGGKAIRKLEVGETIEPIGEEETDPKRGLARIKAKESRDGKEGYVTIKGNQGTAYFEPSTKHYVCTRSTPLEKMPANGSPAFRSLEEGEVFEVTDGPKSDVKEGVNRLRCRSFAAGTEGWVTLGSKGLQRWSPQHKVSHSTVLHDGVEIASAKTIRKLEVGEIVEALEAPLFEKTASVLRLRARAEKDGAVGFATARGNQGTAMMEPLLASSA